MANLTNNSAPMKEDIQRTSIEEMHAQTSLISWLELQRFFAKGQVYCVDQDVDLVATAAACVDNDVEYVQGLIEKGKIQQVSDSQAKHWYELKAELWCAVAAPLVLVQQPPESKN